MVFDLANQLELNVMAVNDICSKLDIIIGDDQYITKGSNARFVAICVFYFDAGRPNSKPLM